MIEIMNCITFLRLRKDGVLDDREDYTLDRLRQWNELQADLRWEESWGGSRPQLQFSPR